jgi:hypothetical protein
MDNTDFNEPADRPKYTYRLNPLYEKSFQVMKWNDEFNEYVPFGDYTVVDDKEEHELSEKRVMNLVSALNERRRLMDLSEETKSKTYFHPVQGQDDDGKSRVIFYINTGEGASKENAVFTFEGGIDDDV